MKAAPASIRVRLGVALIVALLPILALATVQTVNAFLRDASDRRALLLRAAERSAAVMQARIESAQVLLETLDTNAIGYQCAARLSEVKARVPGFDNLIRLGADGRVRCAAASVGGSSEARTGSVWFQRMAQGDQTVVSRPGDSAFGDTNTVLAGHRAVDAAGRFDGAFVAMIDLASLKPNLVDAILPPGASLALIDESGGYILATQGFAQAPLPPNWQAMSNGKAGSVFKGPGGRQYAISALSADDAWVVLSQPRQDLWSWAAINPLSGLIFPLLAFSAAFVAVWVVTDRVVLRWLHYLQRIAAIYGRGRLSIRPTAALEAPAEIRELAEAMGDMAQAVAARDHSLVAALDQKDSLMREIHHRVKNNLQVIGSLLSIQQRALSDPGARTALTDTAWRISALALIYRVLYQGGDMEVVDLRQFLEELIGQITEVEPRGERLNTELQVQPLAVDPDRLAPIALFLVEAITANRRFGLGEGGGTLRIASRAEDDRAVLEIDFSPPQGRPESAIEGDLGTPLMKAFGRQLRGQVDSRPNGRGGAVTRLDFPLQNPAKAA